MNVVGNYNFPQANDVRVLMMPFIQGDPDSLPDFCAGYDDFVEQFYLEQGKTGYLTIDNSIVTAGESQRGYGSDGRNIHTEACAGDVWGSPPAWGRSAVTLDSDLRVLIANNINSTCRVWDAEKQPTADGMLDPADYPEDTGTLLGAGEVAEIGIYTPHECVAQDQTAHRQFIRVVGSGVYGREPSFTRNPKHNE